MDVLKLSYWGSYWFAYVCTFGIGSLVGIFEIVSRYRDAPFEVLTQKPAVAYCIVNGLVSTLALFLIHSFGLSVEVEDGLPAATQTISDVLLAGFGAMFVFRGSFLKLRDGNGKQTELGFSEVIIKFMDIIDREVDRKRAEKRSRDINQIMNGISFECVKMVVMEHALDMMQNIPSSQQDELIDVANSIGSLDIPDPIKARKLGIRIYDLIGSQTLQIIIDKLRDSGLLEEYTDKHEERQPKEILISTLRSMARAKIAEDTNSPSPPEKAVTPEKKPNKKK